VTRLGEPPADLGYSGSGLTLSIPGLGVTRPIIGIPLKEQGWQLDWLWDQVGYLEGTAFPTWEGNTVLTAHAYLPNGLPGPFAQLRDLRWGDEVVIRAYGRDYIYQVQESKLIKPGDLAAFKHEELDWLTLLTCVGFDEKTDTYRWRSMVRAVLVRVEGG